MVDWLCRGWLFLIWPGHRLIWALAGRNFVCYKFQQAVRYEVLACTLMEFAEPLFFLYTIVYMILLISYFLFW